MDLLRGPVLLLLILLGLALLVPGCLGPNDGGGDASCVGVSEFPDDTARYDLFVDGRHTVEVALEVANAPEERRIGLMNRESLELDRGMIFVYPDEGPRAFWMKNTLIPLDMVFLDSEFRVLNVETAQPQPNASEVDLNRYRSDGEAQYVLEFNAGFAAEHGIEAGDQLKLCPVQ